MALDASYFQPDQKDTSMDWAINPKIQAAKTNPTRQPSVTAPLTLPPQKALSNEPNDPPTSAPMPAADEDFGPAPQALDAPGVTRTGSKIDFTTPNGGTGSVSSANSDALGRVEAGLRDPQRMQGISAMPNDQTSQSNTKIAAHERGMQALRNGGDYQAAYDSIANPGALPQRGAFDLAALWQQANQPISTSADIGTMMNQVRGRKQAMALLGQLVQNQGQLAVTAAQGGNALQREQMGNESAERRTNTMAGANRFNAALDYDSAIHGQNATAANQALTREDAQRKDQRLVGARTMLMNMLRQGNAPDDLFDINPKDGKRVPNMDKVQGYYDMMIGENPQEAIAGGADPRGPTNLPQAVYEAKGVRPHTPAHDAPWYSLSLDTPYDPGGLQLPKVGPHGEALPAQAASNQPAYRQRAINAGQ